MAKIKKQKTAIQLIADERKRQVEKGFNAEHDDSHVDSSILDCAVMIANECIPGVTPIQLVEIGSGDWQIERTVHVREKYGNSKIARLTIAAAMIAAEIDRLIRAKQRE
jgi:hypothetical protein